MSDLLQGISFVIFYDRIEMQPLLAKRRNASVSTEIVGNIGKDQQERDATGAGTYMALCTLDGKSYLTFTVVRQSKRIKISF